MLSKDQVVRLSHTLILTFHGVGEPPGHVGSDEAPVWVSRQDFETVLDLVRARPEVKITFDDGNASDAAIGLPALVERGLRATFFVVADRIGKPGYLSQGQLDDLVAAGMEIGSHGLHHRPWGRLAPDALRAEIIDARDQLEQAVGRPVTEAACPFGSYRRRVLKRLREQGFERVYTSDKGWAKADQWLQARNTLHHDDAIATTSSLLKSEPRFELTRGLKLALKRWR